MTLMHYRRPYSLLSQLQQDINDVFQGQGALASTDEAAATADWTPAVDIREERGDYLIQADIPGIKPKDIEITMENKVLSISGHREEVKEEDRDGYRRVERVRGQFMRRFSLPDATDANNITAVCKDGVLELRIPKSPDTQPRRIEVKH